MGRPTDGLRSAVITGLLSLAFFVLGSTALAAEEANGPTVTGETGLFSLLSGDTLPRGGWSFGLYYNNWERVVGFDDPGPPQPAGGASDPAVDPLTALFSGPAGRPAWNRTIVLPVDDTLTPARGDLFDLGHFPLGGTATRDFAFEIFRPAGSSGVPPAWSPSDGRPPVLDIDWEHLASPPATFDYGYLFMTAGGIDANASFLGRSRFDLNGNGRGDDLDTGQILAEGEPADVNVPPVVEVRGGARARASRLRVLPVCSGRQQHFRGFFRGTLFFDAHGGSAASRQFRRHIGGSLATNAAVTNPPQFGPGGKLAFEFAGCGAGRVQVFATFHSLGLPAVIRGLRPDVASTLVDLRLDGRPVRHRLEVQTKRDRAVRASSLWPSPPKPSARDQVGLRFTVTGRFDRSHIGSAARGRRLTLTPRARIVGIVSRCLTSNGTPAAIKRAGRVVALACRHAG